MIKLQLATALKWWIDSKMDEISIRMNGAKAGRVGGKSLDYYKGYEQALKTSAAASIICRNMVVNMIKYTRQPLFDTIENYLLSHQDKLYVTTRYTYYFKTIGDCAGIFRVNRKNGLEDIVAYYHEGEY